MKEIWTQTHTEGKGHVRTFRGRHMEIEAETRIMLPSAKDGRGHQKLERKGKILPYSLCGSVALPTP